MAESPLEVEVKEALAFPTNRATEYEASSQELLIKSDEPALPPIQPSASAQNEKSIVKCSDTSFNEMLSAVHLDVRKALGEAQNVTTHDMNLERQYRQIVEENSKLHAQLYRARREITHLKGHLTIMELIPSEIREQKNRHIMQQKKRQIQEMHLQNRVKGKDLQQLMSLISYEARSQTVNAKGKYIDFRHHKRHKTFPLASKVTPSSLHDKGYLPPILPGCQCSVCNSQQSLGAICCTRGKVSSSTKSGQQILLGDRVILQSDQIGTVKYIGKLNFDALNRVFIGIHLDFPVGITDGTIRGQQYFQCPPGHGIFVLPHDILCVTGRKSLSSGVAQPKNKIKLDLPASRSSQHDFSTKMRMQYFSPPQTGSPDVITNAEIVLDQELHKLLQEKQNVGDLVDSSVSDMAQRMLQLKARMHSSQHDNDNDSAVSLAEEEDANAVNIPTDDKINEKTLANVVLAALQAKDLGHSGYVTMKELSSALTSDELRLTTNEVEEVISVLGLQDTKGHGIEYSSISPSIANIILQIRAASY